MEPGKVWWLTIHNISDPRRLERSLKIEISWRQLKAQYSFSWWFHGGARGSQAGFGKFLHENRHKSPEIAIFRPFFSASNLFGRGKRLLAWRKKRAELASQCGNLSLKNLNFSETFQFLVNCTSSVFQNFRPWCKTIKFQVWRKRVSCVFFKNTKWSWLSWSRNDHSTF